MQETRVGQLNLEQNNEQEQSQLFSKIINWRKTGSTPKKQSVKQNLDMQLCDQFYSESQYNLLTVMEVNNKKNLGIFSIIVLITIGMLFFSNYDNHMRLEIIRNVKIITSYDRLSQKVKFSQVKYKNCPSQLDTFHVYLNQTDNNSKYLPQHLSQQSTFCNIPVLGYSHLKVLVEKWNQRFTENHIILDEFKTVQQKTRILILLRQYFKAGTYTEISLPYSKIAQRCWKHVINGHDMLFINFISINQKKIYVPDTTKFSRVRFPFSPQVKNMIDRLIKKEDYLEECKQRQCLIIKCID